ncbi:MAG: hypothetical protein U0235_16020 [Polyangiaceae bacterium]
MPLVASSAFACGGSTADAGNPGDVSGALETSSSLKPGTYKHSGAPDAWTIKTLVLQRRQPLHRRDVSGPRLSDQDVRTTTSRDTVSGNTLTIKFEKGNVFEVEDKAGSSSTSRISSRPPSST